jgi:hypothetical protein
LKSHFRRFEDQKRDAALVSHSAFLKDVSRSEAKRAIRIGALCCVCTDCGNSDQAVNLVDDATNRVVGLVRQRDVPAYGQTAKPKRPKDSIGYGVHQRTILGTHTATEEGAA